MRNLSSAILLWLFFMLTFCNSMKFDCEDGSFIDRELECDKIVDCSNFRDEAYCRLKTKILRIVSNPFDSDVISRYGFINSGKIKDLEALKLLLADCGAMSTIQFIKKCQKILTERIDCNPIETSEKRFNCHFKWKTRDANNSIVARFDCDFQMKEFCKNDRRPAFDLVASESFENPAFSLLPREQKEGNQPIMVKFPKKFPQIDESEIIQDEPEKTPIENNCKQGEIFCRKDDCKKGQFCDGICDCSDCSDELSEKCSTKERY